MIYDTNIKLQVLYTTISYGIKTKLLSYNFFSMKLIAFHVLVFTIMVATSLGSSSNTTNNDFYARVRSSNSTNTDYYARVRGLSEREVKSFITDQGSICIVCFIKAIPSIVL